jgi:hypothetical protein
MDDQPSRIQRIEQIVLLVTFLPFCWLAFMAVHELGHVVVGWLSGGKVTKVIIHPLAISRTDVAPNPFPLAVAWGGPLIGVLLPLLIWGILCRFRLPGHYLARFFAGFCLVANGAYIGVGAFSGIGDAGDLLRHGSPTWLLWLFGLLSVVAGFLLWNGLGPRFGLGPAQGRVDRWAVFASVGLFVLLYASSLMLSRQA